MLLGDMPWIEPRLADALIDAFLAREGALAAVPYAKAGAAIPFFSAESSSRRRCALKATRARAG